MGKLHRSRAAKADLFERLVHDLRNPLGILLNFAEALGDAEGEEGAELLARIPVNARRLLHVIEEFSLLHDFRRGRVRRVIETCDLMNLAAGIAAELEAMEQRPGAIRIEGGAGDAVAGGIYLNCALRCLLREALRATSRDAIPAVVVRAEGPELIVEIATARPEEAECGTVRVLMPDSLELELVERVAGLYEGAVRIDREQGGYAIRLALPASG